MKHKGKTAPHCICSGQIDDFDNKPNTSHTEGIARFIKWYKDFYAVGDISDK